MQTSKRGIVILAALMLLLILVLGVPVGASGPPVQEFYVPLPEPDVYDFMVAVDTPGSSSDPSWPMVSSVGFTIASPGTYIYYDHRENGFTGDLENTPDETWGDGNTANGFPPRLNGADNTGTQTDVFAAGDVVDIVNNIPDGYTNGPDPVNCNNGVNNLCYDGGDRVGTSRRISVTRSMYNSGNGSLLAGAVEVFATSAWGTNFAMPVGEDTIINNDDDNFEDTRAFIMASTAGTTVSLNGVSQGTIGQGGTMLIADINQGDRITSTNDIQVHLLTGDIDAAWETRWFAIPDVSLWDDRYVNPVGTVYKYDSDTGNTNHRASGCTSAWVFNPGIVPINIDFTIGNSDTGTVNVPAGSAVQIPGTLNYLDQFNGPGYNYANTNSDGTTLWSTNWVEQSDDGFADSGDVQVTYPDEVMRIVGNAGNGNRRAVNGLTTDLERAVLNFDLVSDATSSSEDTLLVQASSNGTTFTTVGFLQGNDNNGFNGVDITEYISPNTAIQFVLQDSLEGEYYEIDNIQIDTIDTIPAGYGAEFVSQGGTLFYSLATIDCDGQLNGTSNSSRTNFYTTGERYDWGFPLVPEKFLSTNLLVGQAPGCTDDCSNSVGTEIRSPVWVTALADTTIYWDYGDQGFSCANEGAIGNSQVVTTLESINISDASDQDMTGARIFTCDNVKIAGAWGQDPAKSGPSDNEALDLGYVILPFQTDITIDKSVDQTLVQAGAEVTYTYLVTNPGQVGLDNINIVDDVCDNPIPTESGGFNIGDINPQNNILEPELAETWTFTCQQRIDTETTNIAYSTGEDINTDDLIQSSPDQETVRVTSAVGNYVWVDENNDGIQDAGEPGIPNVKVNLTGLDNEGNIVTLSTYTDANGGYLFKDVPPGGYVVGIDENTLPKDQDGNDAMTQTTNPVNPGADFGNQTRPYPITVVSADENLTADFGFNWNTDQEVNNPVTNDVAAIGDRVWIDANGDGKQDANEIGLSGITVNLYSVVNGVETLVDSDTTDDNGNYIFDDLPPGAYLVKIPSTPGGYTQTGDPDELGATCSSCDNQTTTPVVLGPGDVFLNADFGYLPESSGTLGDTVWLDADRSGAQNGEPGIPGVTVSLIKDLNENGEWDEGEPIIGTDVTDENGNYLFSGLPVADGQGTDDYLIWVNDSNNVLGELTATVDKDGANPTAGLVTGLGISAATDIGPGSDLTHDFGYAPPSHDVGDGLIGDTVFMDSDGSNSPDPGEGIEGVTVELYNAAGDTLLATTVTNENGTYYFGNLPAGSYKVVVDTSTLPNDGTGLTNSVDPGGEGNSESDVILAAGQVDLTHDFGYVGTNPGSIGNLIWNDINADGDVDAGDGEAGISGVTVDLYEDVNGDGAVDPGDRLVGTTTTVDGDYSFNNLPPGDYLVDVTDTDGVLAGYWQSRGTDNADNNSQADPYPVTLGAGETNNTADFGYYILPGSIGNYVWQDMGVTAGGNPGEGNDGLFNEPVSAGINDVEVTLTITYPDGTVIVLKTVTANDPVSGNPGWYNFGNLLLDEDYKGDTTGSDGGEPTYVLSIGAPPPSFPFDTHQGVPDNTGIGLGQDNNADVSGNEPGFPGQGTADNSNDFGYSASPTAVDFLAMDVSGSQAASRALPAAVAAVMLLLGLVVYAVTRRRQLSG